MEHLEFLVNYKDTSIYSLCGESVLKRYIASTNETKSILNKPEIVGQEFRQKLMTGISKILKYMPEDFKKNFDEKHVDVLHFLRGGLNFGLMEALNKAYKFNNHSASFMSSERKKQEGKWRIKDDQYSKLSVQPSSTVFIGDIVATGITLKAGLAKLYEHTSGEENLPAIVKDYLFQGIEEKQSKQKIPLKGLVFFTIGCENLEKILETYHHLFCEAFKEYKDTYVVYLEGRFKLASEADNLKIRIVDTDLLRYPALLSPEFELSQYSSLAYPLERCVVYDGGSRSFNVKKHITEVIEYWKELSKEDMILEEALKERWPEEEYVTKKEFIKAKKSKWQGISNKMLDEIYAAYQKRWNNHFGEKASATGSLRKFCTQRIVRLSKEHPV